MFGGPDSNMMNSLFIGHHIPSRPEWTTFFKDFITSFAMDKDVAALTDSSSSMHSPPSLTRSLSLSSASDSSIPSSSSSSWSPQSSAPVNLPLLSPPIRLSNVDSTVEVNVCDSDGDRSRKEAKRWRVVSFRLPKSSKSSSDQDKVRAQSISLQLDQLEESMSCRSAVSRGDVDDIDGQLEQHPEAANLLGLCAA